MGLWQLEESEAAKELPLGQRGRRRSETGRIATAVAWRQRSHSRPGVVLRIGGKPHLSTSYLMTPSPSLGLPVSQDKPCALGASPFPKGELLATAGCGHFFTASLSPPCCFEPLPRYPSQASRTKAFRTRRSPAFDGKLISSAGQMTVLTSKTWTKKGLLAPYASKPLNTLNNAAGSFRPIGCHKNT